MTLSVSELRNQVQMSLSQGTMASTFFTEQDEKSDHLTPSSGFSPSIPPFWVPGQDLREGPVGMEMEATGYGRCFQTCIPSASINHVLQH